MVIPMLNVNTRITQRTEMKKMSLTFILLIFRVIVYLHKFKQIINIYTMALMLQRADVKVYGNM